MTREELRNAIGNTCDIMRREGLTTMDHMEQLSWLLFLKSFEETGNSLEAEAAYKGRAYDRILAGDYRWSDSLRRSAVPTGFLPMSVAPARSINRGPAAES